MTPPNREISGSDPPWAHLILIAAVSFAAYANALDAPFVYDDLSNISQNTLMPVEGFDVQGFARAAFESRSPRPLANLSFAINHAVCGFEVRCYRTVNVVIHIANGLLVYSLAVLLFLRLRPGEERRARQLSLLAALIFVAHPIQIQSVTYVVQRMTSMATMFYLLALLLWLRGRLQPGPDRRKWWLAAATSGVLAFGSKQIAVTLPFAMLLIEWIFFQQARGNWLRRRVGPFAGLLAVTAVLGVAYLALLGFPGYEARDFTLGQRLLTQLRVVPFYLGLLLLPLPARFSLIHSFEPSVSLVDPLSTLFGGAFLVAFLGVGVAAARREPLLSFAILWFLLQLLLESSVLPLEMAYEHRLYLPWVAVSLLLADVVCRLTRRRLLWTAALGTALVLGLATATHLRNRVWKDATVLWADVAAKSPLDGRAQRNLAFALQRIGRVDEAKRNLNAALVANPDNAHAHHILGILEDSSGRSDPASAHFAEAIRLEPDEPLFQMKLGLLLGRSGDVAGGTRALEALTRRHPDFAKGFLALGVILELDGQIARAQPLFIEALRIDPDNIPAHQRRATYLANAGDLRGTASHLREIARLQPYDARTRTLLRRAEAGSAPGKAANPIAGDYPGPLEGTE